MQKQFKKHKNIKIGLLQPIFILKCNFSPLNKLHFAGGYLGQTNTLYVDEIVEKLGNLLLTTKMLV